MIRKRKDIELEINARKASLEAKIDYSIRAEKVYEEDIAFLNNKLSELASETCFEDTREGITKALEDTAFGKVDEILRELSEKTGKSYNREVANSHSKVIWGADLATKENTISNHFGGRL